MLKKPCECVRVCQRQRPSIKSTVLLTRVMIDETSRQQNAHNQHDLFAIRLLFFFKVNVLKVMSHDLHTWQKRLNYAIFQCDNSLQ